MSEEEQVAVNACSEECKADAPKVKPKRDIIRFKADQETAINLEHVTIMYIPADNKKRIMFELYTKAQPIDFEDEESTAKAFESILNIWSADALE